MSDKHDDYKDVDHSQNWKLPEENLDKIKIKKPKSYAGGYGALISSVKFAKEQLGLPRATKTLLKMNQLDGFDCAGCAWPDPDQAEQRHTWEFCENGVKALANEATKKVIGESFFAKWSLKSLSEQSDYWLEKQGRIACPLVIHPDQHHYEPISWRKAYELIASRINELENPNQAIFYTSGRTSNEAAFIYQLMVRLLGTNNLPDCSNLCHESSGVAMKESIGVGKGTVTLDDFNHADCIFVIGQNPGTNHPRMLSSLQQAVKNGAKIINVNPILEASGKGFIHPQEFTQMLNPIQSLAATKLTHLHVPLKIGGDVAFFKGLNKELSLREKKNPRTIFDWSFIANYCSDSQNYLQSLEQVSWKDIEESCQISHEQIKEVVDIVVKSKKIICCWAMGLTQHPNAVANIQEVLNFLMLRGNLGRVGAGACPVRGHSNVQGDRTMGIWERPGTDFLQALERHFCFSPPHEHGHDVVSAINAMNERPGHVFMAMGGNFLSASPDTSLTAKALSQCDLTIHVSTKLNRSHLVPGATGLILPCLTRSEMDLNSSKKFQFVTVENSMGIVHKSQGHLPPISSQLKSEVRIIGELAQFIFSQHPQFKNIVPWQNWCDQYDLIRDAIEKVVDGFKDFNEKIKTQKQFYLPHPVRDERIFPTHNKKANFFVHPITKHELEENELLMMTIRSHDQYNTTIYDLNDRYRGIYGGRKVVLINLQDMKRLGLKNGDKVDITSTYKGSVRKVRSFKVVPYQIPQGCCATYFPETNPLVPIDLIAEKSHTPASKCIPVKLLLS